ncbi:chemotaxis protein CheW [uncultured Methanospirillum sp.]|uniref:chemotaxis protein CheW n=1 Tax=uncultured Methanospirillum sp. TaxID=262503 RepID=UPI0029C737D4|nr:chemotaxis protein CheW [uncultured Methanospirillum sp.]
MGEYEQISSKKIHGVKTETEEEIQIVEFLLGKNKFALNLFDVKEIVEYTRITPVPESGHYIKGIIDLRGDITTIIDLKSKLGIVSSKEDLKQSRIIVIDSSVTNSKSGILVDDVATVLSITESEIDKKVCDKNGSSFILGVIRHKQGDKESDNGELVIWIDVPGLLRDMGQ